MSQRMLGFSFVKTDGYQHATDRESIWRMIGEFFRELGVLVIVFYPIESHLRGSAWGKALIAAVGVSCLIVGIVIERRR
jgi:hypothetical protein